MFSSDTTQVSDGGYQISRSLRFNSADSTYLSRTPASAGNQKTWTWSSWVKKAKNTGADTLLSVAPTAGLSISILLYTTNILEFYVANAAGTDWSEDTSAVYRDNSSWYHVVLSVDTTQATAANRLRWYVNGVQQSTVQTYGQIPQNQDTYINQSGKQHGIGRNEDGASSYADFYLAEVNFIDGQALTPSSFGETNAQTGVWQPKAFAGTYGTNGFYLNFSDNSNTTAATLGKDYSGNGNNWTPNNFSVTAGVGNDSFVDSPTSYGTDTGVGGTVRGNYCTMNPLQNGMTNAPRNGNLEIAGSADVYRSLFGTFGVSSGKWYFEVVITSGSGVTNVAWSSTSSIYQYAGEASTSYGYELENGNKINGGGTTAYGSALTTNDVFMCAADMDNLKLFFGKNGTWFASSDPVTGTSPAYTFAAGTYFFQMRPYSAASNTVVTTNFGQRPFAYTAPSGFKALCTQNLPTPTIGATTATQAGKFFNPVLWTGDSTNPRTITGVGFQPDWVWVKRRNAATNHFLQDAVRGVTSTNSRSLVSNNTDAETNYYTVNGGVTAFTSDGFTTSGGVTNLNINESGQTYVAWNWKANGSGSSNTSGSITSTVSANTTSGFSVVTYTGNSTNATVGHGLGVAPSMVIVKVRSTTDGWFVYNQNIGNTQYLRLNTTDAAATFNLWQSTSPTSTVFSIATDPTVNLSGATYVAYCFAEVAGYSKFGSYTGNGSADGPFVFTGFRPAFVMVKNASAGGKWVLMDTSRGLYNVMSGTNALYPNLSDAEGTDSANREMDFLSNGFKLRCTGGDANGSGNTIIYMAFASSPFKFSLAR